MGTIKSFIEKTGNNVFENIEYFVETGTGLGASVSYAKNHIKEENIYSVEIDAETHKRCVQMFNNSKINFRCGQSVDFLQSIDFDGRCLYWLDAHFPGEYRFNAYNSESDIEKRYPLENELKILSKNKNTSKSILLIDDLRIYVDDSYENGSWLDRKNYDAPQGIEFIHKMFSETHYIKTELYDEGYILLTPKSITTE